MKLMKKMFFTSILPVLMLPIFVRADGGGMMGDSVFGGQAGFMNGFSMWGFGEGLVMIIWAVAGILLIVWLFQQISKK